MNRQRDIDHLLDAWFVDGPSAMPDRLFDTVLDEVGRMPQRRRPWSSRKVRPMSLQLKIAAAVAVIVAIGGAGLLLLGRPPDQPPVGQTPTPSGPTAAPSLRVSAALNHTFIGEPRPKPAAGVPDESIITFSTRTIGAGAYRDWSFSYDVDYLKSDVFASGPQELLFVTPRRLSNGCELGDEGRYTWTLSPGGTKLTLTLVADACDERAAVVPGNWIRAACADPEPPDGLCLGELEAGEYTTQYFDPFQPVTTAWRARFGAMTYEVPAGWSNTADGPTGYALRPIAATGDTGVYLFSDARVVTDVEPCTDQLGDVGHAYRDIRNWLLDAEGVIAGDVVSADVGLFPGWYIDVRMDPSWTTTCPWSGGEPYRSLFVDPDVGNDGLFWGLTPESRMRLYMLDIGDGRTLLIDIEALGEPTWREVLGEATPIVESMAFHPPAG